jgi:tetratricopeptide (TPR) repeat protein
MALYDDLAPADKYNRQGIDLFVQGDYEGAKKKYLLALHADPEFLPPLANLIPILSQENDLLAALSLTRKILNINPLDGNQWNNAGNLLTRLQRYDEAEAALDLAGSYVPDDRSVWHNKALLHHRMDDNDRALEYIQRVKDMGDTSNSLLNDEAHMLLANGDLSAALEVYEVRWWGMNHLPPWDYHIQEWTGQDLDGKRILLHHEQGYGDTIMTARFTKDLLARGARVTLGLPRSLCDFFLAQDFVKSVLAIEDMTDSNMDAFEYHSPLYSAMRHLQITQDKISSKPYLKPPQIVVPPVDKKYFNVGICWASGKRGNEMDWRRRLTPLKEWFRLAEIPGVQLWSLYKRQDEDDKDPHDYISQALIRDITPKLSNWAETAAFVAKLDAVVTIDTAIAHLAAGMGKPTIMLAQFQHCWRWWNLYEGSGLPWYETMEIMPQTEPGNWQDQLISATNEIKHMMKKRDKALAA